MVTEAVTLTSSLPMRMVTMVRVGRSRSFRTRPPRSGSVWERRCSRKRLSEKRAVSEAEKKAERARRKSKPMR